MLASTSMKLARLTFAFASVAVALSLACQSDSGATASPAGATCGPPFASGAPTAATVRCADPARMEHARPTHIVDGDTLDVVLDGKTERVRIFGIDTPERGEPCFREASARLGQLAGSEVRLLPDRRARDPNGRLLRYVYTPSGESIDARLIAEGLAHAWTRDGALRDALVALETQARASRTGCLWQ